MRMVRSACTCTASVRRWRLGLAVGLVLALFLPVLARAESDEAGLVLSISSKRIRETADRLNQALENPLKRCDKDHTFWLICDFNPDGSANDNDNFADCYLLAEGLRRLDETAGKSAGRRIRTVAYVHGDITRHSVLPVLACDEIVLSQDPPARLGPVTKGGTSLDEVSTAAYQKIARIRKGDPITGRGIQAALVQKLYDPSARPTWKGKPLDLPREQTVGYNFSEASAYGLCQKDPRNDLSQVLRAFRLPRSVLTQAPDRPVVWQMTLSGRVSGELKERVQRHVKRARGEKKANVLVFELACGEGDSGQAAELARYLAGLNDSEFDQPVQTWAYVTPQARNTAAFLALACDRIVMHPKAGLYDFESYLSANPTRDNMIEKNLVEVARKMHYPAIIVQGLVDRPLRILKVQGKREGEGESFLSETKFNEDNRTELRWQKLEQIKPVREEDANKYLILDAAAARRVGLAHEEAEKLDGVYSLIGVDPREVLHSESDFLDGLGEFLRNPWTRLVLIMLGITCLILELKMPGVSLPGVIAAVCFVLFFWSHSQLHGEMTKLALLLFLLGLALLLLEIFVIPGFGVCGIAGIILVVGSLGLVAYGHWPRTTADWMGYGQTLGPLGLVMLGSVCLAFLLARYLPNIPYANRLLLKPQFEENGEPTEESAPLATKPELAALLGAIGVAATPLRPAGKVQFGDEFVDVIAEGSYVQPGSRVQVFEIEGNRVVVKEV